MSDAHDDAHLSDGPPEPVIDEYPPHLKTIAIIAKEMP